MEEQLISFNTIKLAQEKGFTIPSNISKNWYTKTGNFNGYSPKAVYYVCTQSLLQKWLREVHNIYVNSDYYQGYSEVRFYYDIKILSDNSYNGNQDSDDNIYTYEEALELGLQEGLKLI